MRPLQLDTFQCDNCGKADELWKCRSVKGPIIIKRRIVFLSRPFNFCAECDTSSQKTNGVKSLREIYLRDWSERVEKINIEKIENYCKKKNKPDFPKTINQMYHETWTERVERIIKNIEGIENYEEKNKDKI